MNGKWKVENGAHNLFARHEHYRLKTPLGRKFSMRLCANVSKFGFSLVELMISLIVISIVTAAFTPILTKKLKTSDQSIGTATALSITSSALCNSISKGCIECENDKCLAVSDGYFLNESTGKSQACNTTITGCAQCADSSTCTKSEAGYFLNGSGITKCTTGCSACTGLSACTGCNSGYWLNGSSCTACSIQNAACQTCSNGSTCTKCADNYLLSSGKCAACPKHCKTCSSTSVCTKCADGYTVSTQNTCYKYQCDSVLCYLTYGDKDSVLSIYRYYLGHSKTPFPAGINRCYPDQNCPYGFGSPVCFYGEVSRNWFTAASAGCDLAAPLSSYGGCARTVCNYYAAEIAANAYKPFHLANKAEQDVLRLINFQEANHPADPFCGVINAVRCPARYEIGYGPDGRSFAYAVYVGKNYSSSSGWSTYGAIFGGFVSLSAAEYGPNVYGYWTPDNLGGVVLVK